MGVVEIDWLGLCRRVVEAQRKVLASHRGIEARTRYEGVGEGGDRTLVIDRACEDVVFAELEGLAAAGHSLVAISEERGEVAFGSGGETRVVIDPIDGSLNARRTLPSHSLSLAVASGPTMADVEFGYVFDFGAGEEFWARRGEGARLGDEPIASLEHGDDLEVVVIESAEPSWMLPVVEALQDRTYRIRVIGSIAISLSYVAASRCDGLVTSRPCRSVDAAAAQLIAREMGALVAFGDLPLDETDLGLDARYQLAAAWTSNALQTLLAAQE